MSRPRTIVISDQPDFMVWQKILGLIKSTKSSEIYLPDIQSQVDPRKLSKDELFKILTVFEKKGLLIRRQVMRRGKDVTRYTTRWPFVKVCKVGSAYYAQSIYGGLIKIGHSECPEDRLSQFQNVTPFKLRLLATEPGGRKKEEELHERFSILREHGEWFRPEYNLLAYIARISKRKHDQIASPVEELLMRIESGEGLTSKIANYLRLTKCLMSSQVNRRRLRIFLISQDSNSLEGLVRLAMCHRSLTQT